MLASTFLLSTRFSGRDQHRQRAKAVFVGSILALMVVAGSLAYTVEPGDTLANIAAAHDVTLDELLKVNDVDDPDLILPGQEIVIPGGGEGGSDAVHVVGEGETLDQIAAQYSSSTAAIAEANSIGNVDFIRIGQRLRIPGSNSGGGTPSAEYHVVEPGDTLASIAAKYGVTPEQVAEANGITNPSLIYVGARLALSGSTFVADPEPATEGNYTVKAGDTLGSIAKSHGVTVGALVEANGISNVDVIRIGQKLTVPGGTSTGGGGGSAWVCPVNNADYVNDWGLPRNGDRFHEGTDLFAPRGAEVRAPVGGEISLITGTVGGLQFYLYGNDGVTYIGTHLDGFGRAGTVEAGEVIGYVGDSGNARGGPTHLHFEMHPDDGEAVNPYPTLSENGC